MNKLLQMFLGFSLTIGFASVGQAESVRTAVLIEVQGDVQAKIGGSEWKSATEGLEFQENDEIKTAEASYAKIQLDGSGETGELELKEQSQMRLSTLSWDEAMQDKITYLDLAIGKVLVHAEKLQRDSKFEVRTPNASAGVRGTVFEVSVEE